MIQKHISQYFEPVRGLLGLHPERVDLAFINSVLKSNGCPEGQIDSVVNGVMTELMVDNIAPVDCSVRTFGRDGNEVQDTRVNPTKAQLTDWLTKKRFAGLETERVEKLIDFLLQKSVLEEINGRLYRKMLPPKGMPVAL